MLIERKYSLSHKAEIVKQKKKARNKQLSLQMSSGQCFWNVQLFQLYGTCYSVESKSKETDFKALRIVEKETKVFQE